MTRLLDFTWLYVLYATDGLRWCSCELTHVSVNSSNVCSVFRSVSTIVLSSCSAGSLEEICGAPVSARLAVVGDMTRLEMNIQYM